LIRKLEDGTVKFDFPTLFYYCICCIVEHQRKMECLLTEFEVEVIKHIAFLMYSKVNGGCHLIVNNGTIFNDII